MIDKNKFQKNLKILAEVFDKKISPEFIAVYYEVLVNLKTEIFESSVKEILKTSSFFPRPADFFEAAKKIQARLPKKIVYEKTCYRCNGTGIEIPESPHPGTRCICGVEKSADIYDLDDKPQNEGGIRV